MMIEVKEGDKSFSAPLFRFHGYLKSAFPMQIVYNLKHRKSNGPAKMIPVVDFLLEMELQQKR